MKPSSNSHRTAPQDRVAPLQMVIYGLGGFVNNLLAGCVGAMMIVLNLGLGMNQALVGLLGSIPRFFDALTDPLMGYISDNTQTRWGRRRPYIFVGAIAVGILFIVLWQLPNGQSEGFYFWYFLVVSLLFFLAYTIFATPWVALGYELTPDYNERTRLMGVQNFISQMAYFVPPWLLVVMQDERFFDSMIEGASRISFVIAAFVIAVGVLPAIFLRERMVNIAKKEQAEHNTVKIALKDRVADFFSGFATTLRMAPFMKLCLATFLVFNGFILVASFQTYVLIYYVFGGDTKLGAQFAAYAGTLGTFANFAVIAFVAWLATRIGKRKTFAIATGISMLGYALKWFCYNPDFPWLILIPAPLIAFGLGGLFTLMPALIADVVDLDELSTRQRREGMFGSIFWWVVKLGMTAALAGSGFLLNATGFDVALGGNQAADTLYMMRLFDSFIPVVTSAIAIWAVMTNGLSQDRARDVRARLEAFRGAAVA